MELHFLGKKEEIQKEKEILDRGNFISESYPKRIVEDHSTFFSVTECAQKYLNGISLDIEEAKKGSIRGTKMRSSATIYAQNQDITDEESKKEAIYNFLNPNYIEQNNITKENILQKIKINEKVELIPLKMYEQHGNKKSQFALYGKIKNINNPEKQEEVYFIINVDKTNNAFNIIPIDVEKYNDVNDIILGEADEEIKQNKNNVYSFKIMQENDIAQKYFSYYKKLMFENPKEAYSLLDEQYRNKRFGNEEKFEEYVYKNKEEIENYLINEYKVEDITNGKQFICKDQYQNYYTYNVTAAMQFSVMLDNYTMPSEEASLRYERANEKRKVEINCDKWILMLNNRDYKSAYEVLDEGFKDQYFKTEEDFENYTREKFPFHYGLTLLDFNEEAGVYIQRILLKEIRAEEKVVVPETIIMKLTEDGFKMSFRILK